MAKNKKIQKTERQSLDLKIRLFDALKARAPEVFAEDRVVWDKLRKALGEHLETSTDKFNFTWAGKAEAVANVLIPSKAALKPDKKESVEFKESENLFIEGDNLEVLKLLQKPYFEKVKMIYIDPPYNTGNDFVYKDDFRQPLKNYLEQSGQVDSAGNRLSTNTQASGRFHSDWLTMMYPRLKLAWNLLRHDGVIFVSIDDNEVHHLRMMMDEIFGEENFVASIIWKKRSGPPNDKIIGTVHEYVLAYAKSVESVLLQLLPRTDELNSTYTNPDDDPRGSWKAGDLSAGNKGGRATESCIYPIINPVTKEKHLPPDGRRWVYNKEKMQELLKDNRIWFGQDFSGKPKFKRFLSEVRQGMTVSTIFGDVGTNTNASAEFNEFFEEKDAFETPKPILFIQRMVKISSGCHCEEGEAQRSNLKNGIASLPSVARNDHATDIILDFFAGSATTAHAVLAQNQEDGGKRKFILIQMPEPTDPKSEAYKAGYKTIADIAKERIRRVIKGYGDHKPIDDGFKVFKLGPSNYYDNLFEYDPDKTAEENDKAFKDYLNKSQKELFPAKVNEIDIIYENIIKEGLSLNAKIDEIKIGKNKVYKISDAEQELLICLDEKLSAGAIDALTDKEYKEKIFICFDAALTDSDKANLGFNLALKTI